MGSVEDSFNRKQFVECPLLLRWSWRKCFTNSVALTIRRMTLDSWIGIQGCEVLLAQLMSESGHWRTLVDSARFPQDVVQTMYFQSEHMPIKRSSDDIADTLRIGSVE